MTDQELRELVRRIVAQRLATRQSSPSAPPVGSHPSHVQYLTLVNTGEACLIEPSVACTHCGYCKSHGY